MTKLVADNFFLSRFPHFMLNQKNLWSQEKDYTLVGLDNLFDAIVARGSVIGTPATYEAFNTAALHDVDKWPLAWVHRYNRNDAAPGETIPQSRALEQALLVGSVRKVATLLANNDPAFIRFRKRSAGGTNAFVMPPL